MKLLLSLLAISTLFSSCDAVSSTSPALSYADSQRVMARVDSLIKSTKRNALFDTAGLSSAPIKVLSYKVARSNYSGYVRLTWRNVSSKKIDAIKFRWYGVNAFNEPADLGSSYVEGFGGGFSDDPILPGKTDEGEWHIFSRDAKKIILAWPIEVAFSDGSKWEVK